MAQLFGTTTDGLEVHRITLTDEKGNTAGLLSFGAAIQSLVIKGTDVVLGYDNVLSYEKNSGCLGEVIGRCANRIADARFELDGVEYHLSPNKGKWHQHGGFKGFNLHVWDFNQTSDDSVTFTYHSPDGDEGYPGEVDAKVVYTLRNGVLSLDYSARCDRRTLINLTNHVYFNLNGEGNVLEDRLWVDCDAIARPDENSTPDGGLIDVTGTPYDFRTEKPIVSVWHSDHPVFVANRGIDNNFVMKCDGQFRKVASLKAARKDIRMEVWTDQDDLIIYTGNGLKGFDGKCGAKYTPYTGICFEAQYMANAINIEGFRKPVFGPSDQYSQHTEYRFF